MNQWSSEEWFKNWLDLAHIAMGVEAGPGLAEPSTFTAVSDADGRFDRRQLDPGDEEELAA